MQTEREIRARHESGHALIAWNLGVEIQCVSANENEDFLGLCVVGNATSHQRALISRGGAIAESRYTGKSESETWLALCTDIKVRDANDARCEQKCFPGQHDREAAQIIEDHKDALELLAREVFRCPCVDGATATAILAGQQIP
jgi:hypothetical protein